MTNDGTLQICSGLLTIWAATLALMMALGAA